MFNVDKKPEKTAWVNYSKDESYLLRYCPYAKYENLSEKDISKSLLDNILDWKGIEDKNGDLECNTENKKIVFLQQDVWSVERMQFVMVNIVKQSNFFNSEKNLKNLLRA